MDTQQYPPPPPPQGFQPQPQYNAQPQSNQYQSPMFGLIDMMVKDMKFVGVFTIIYGIITCLGCITAAIGIPMIFAGIRLKESADFYLAYANANMNNPDLLMQAFEKQKKFFNIQKILIIISLVLFGLYIVFVIIMIASGVFLGFEEFSRYN
ncbi:MAG: DUF5362 domain-containing protein [Ignavibacteria bacterium]|nr:DUF5362 domain-containing protein [Ignavibacteria bacterium]